MEKDWPILEECPQYRYGLLDAALKRYPWEEDGYEFDFGSFYPPIPDEPPWFRKVVESTKNKIRPPFPEEDIDCCPICRKRSRGPHVPMTFSNRELWNELKKKQDEMEKEEMREMREDPVWNMDPISCPFHILDHFYHPLTESSVV